MQDVTDSGEMGQHRTSLALLARVVYLMLRFIAIAMASILDWLTLLEFQALSRKAQSLCAALVYEEVTKIRLHYKPQFAT